MKFDNHVENVFNCFYLGEMKLFLKGGENKKKKLCINLGGELACIYVIFFNLSLFLHMH